MVELYGSPPYAFETIQSTYIHDNTSLHAGHVHLLVNRWTGASSLSLSLSLSLFFSRGTSRLLSGRVSFAFLRRLNMRPTITIMSSSLDFRERWIAPRRESRLLIFAVLFCDNSACNSNGWQKGPQGGGRRRRIDTTPRRKGEPSPLRRPSCPPFEFLFGDECQRLVGNLLRIFLFFPFSF